MKRIENINLDCKLLQPIREKLEKSINKLTKNAIIAEKEAEITLKINVSVLKTSRNVDDEIQQYLQPNYEYQISEKIKEAKDSYKGIVGEDYAIMLDDEDSLVVKNMNKQQSLFD